MRKNCEDLVEELKEEIHELKHCVKTLNKSLCECEKDKECLIDELKECRCERDEHKCEHKCERKHCEHECEDECHHKDKCTKEHESLLLQFNDMKIKYDKSVENCDKLQNDNVSLSNQVNKLLKLIKFR